MKDATTYPITFPYGATSAPYSAASPHRGDDRPCPQGTPIIINGVTVGLTGATGQANGAHLHVQEWFNDYANTRRPQNTFEGGTVTNIDPNGTQGDGSFGKFITIQNADGWNDSYCHLSQINVKVGDIIGATMRTPSKDEVNAIYIVCCGRSAHQSEIDNYTQHAFDVCFLEVYNSQESINWVKTSQGNTKFTPYSGEQLFVKAK